MTIQNKDINKTISNLLNLVRSINTDAHNYWFKVACALTSDHNDQEERSSGTVYQGLNGKAVFLAWASCSAKFDYGESVNIWETGKSYTDVTTGTLVYLAKEGKALGFCIDKDLLVSQYYHYLEMLEAERSCGTSLPGKTAATTKDVEVIKAAALASVAAYSHSTSPLTDNGYLNRKFSQHLDILHTLKEADLKALKADDAYMNTKVGILRAKIYNIDGECKGYQTIGSKPSKGAKKFYGSISNNFSVLGDSLVTANKNAATVYIVEGVADAFTVFLANRDTVVIAYTASNIPKIIELISQKYPDILLTGIADNDSARTGLKAYENLTIPVYMPDFNKIKRLEEVCTNPTDINDLLQLTSMENVRFFLSQPPVSGNFIKIINMSQRWLSPDDAPLELRVNGMVINSPMGSGKTQWFKKAVAEHRAITPDASILAIAPGRALCKQLALDLEFDCYLDYNRDYGDLEAVSEPVMSNSKKLVITPNSVHKVSHNQYTLVIIDESEAILSEISDGELFEGKSRGTFHLLINLCRSARSFVMADAFTGRITKMFAHHIQRPIYWLENNFRTRENSTLRICREGDTDFVEYLALQAAIAAVNGQGDPVAVASYSKKKIRKTFLANDQIPEDKYFLVTGDDKQDIREITKDPHLINNKRLILYTKALSNGYNVPHHHFKTIYGMFNDDKFTAVECLQMMGRLRDVDKFVIGLKKMQISKVSDKDEIRSMLINSCRMTGAPLGRMTEYTDVTDIVTLDMMVAVRSFKATHNAELTGFIATYAKHMGMTVEYIKPTVDEIEAIKEMKSAKKEATKEEEAALLEQVSQLSVMSKELYKKGAEAFEDAANLTDDEALMLKKSELYHDMRVRDYTLLNSLTVEYELKNLLKHIKFCGRYLMSAKSLQEMDKVDMARRENNRQKHYAVKTKLYRKLFKHAGITSQLTRPVHLVWYKFSPHYQKFLEAAGKDKKELYACRITTSKENAFGVSTNCSPLNNLLKKISTTGLIASQKVTYDVMFGSSAQPRNRTVYWVKEERLELMRRLGLNWAIKEVTIKGLSNHNAKAQAIVDKDPMNLKEEDFYTSEIKPNMKKLTKGFNLKRERNTLFF